MNINFTPAISFNSLKMYNKNGINFAEDFTCNTKDKNKTQHQVSINKNNHIGAYEVNFVNNEDSKLKASQELMIWPEFGYIFIDNMETSDTDRGNGLGTCMHLTNIIEMMENNINKLELISAPSAIPFHIKCGFKPTINWTKEYERRNIKAIAFDSNPELAKYSQDAKELLKANMSPEIKAKIANKILYNYTKKAIKIMGTEEQKYLFPHCTNMQLTRDDVLKHRNYYNKLFDKYGIDYQISQTSA